MKIGDKLWSFDGNRRHYAGKGLSARIIYREHFYPVEIIGETSRSWVIGCEGSKNEIFKVPKSDPSREKHGEFSMRPMLFTEQAVNDECWCQENRHKIVRKIEQENDTTILRRVAEIIGFEA
jgi:hypothetical protein